MAKKKIAGAEVTDSSASAAQIVKTAETPNLPTPQSGNPVALITGGAKRVGATIAVRLHAAGWRIVVHYRASNTEAAKLVRALNAIREESAVALQADLLDDKTPNVLVNGAVAAFGRLDALINNASTFYPTTVGKINVVDWDRLIGSNLKAPLFLAQAAAPFLAESNGSIVNITDIHADRPMKDYLVYSLAKAGLGGLTRALAVELAPKVRVNAVAPGAIEWPSDGQINDAERERILQHIPLKREGGFEQVAEAVKYLVCDAHYVTGQTINVDGGRSVAI